jgi:hypothetical protein
MAALGLGPVEEPEPTPGPRPRGRPLTHKPRRKREPRYSPDGTTADPCVSGRQRLAYVEIPQIFRSRRVQTLFRYSEIPPVPENPIESESEVEELTQDIEVPVTPGPKLHYSQLAGDHCHQCRRKSTKPKMSCRNKACGLKYCVTCVQRLVQAAITCRLTALSADPHSSVHPSLPLYDVARRIRANAFAMRGKKTGADTTSPSKSTAGPSSALDAKGTATAVHA